MGRGVGGGRHGAWGRVGGSAGGNGVCVGAVQVDRVWGVQVDRVWGVQVDMLGWGGRVQVDRVCVSVCGGGR